MAHKIPGYGFKRDLERMLNAGQTRSIVLTGNIHDWFYRADDEADESSGGRYMLLLEYLVSRWNIQDLAQFALVVYELNGPIRVVNPEVAEQLRDAWVTMVSGYSPQELAIRKLAGEPVADRQSLARQFDDALHEALANPTSALEMLRQFCIISRAQHNGKPLFKKNLIILIEGADFLIPQGEIPRLSEADRKRVMICRDWFCDPEFMTGNDSVILLTESKMALNQEITRLPQLLEVKVPAPDLDHRRYFISWFKNHHPAGEGLKLWSSQTDLAELTAGLSIHALMQLLKLTAYTGQTLQPEDVVAKVQEFIQAQLGEEVVEFSRPSHTLKQVVGNTRLKAFLKDTFIPRLKKTGKAGISGAAVAGPLGAGKTFIFEAVAGELGFVVLVLKNLRSKWFGETDIIFERLRRVLEALGKALIFVDEADTQFGGLGGETHETERRLTGKIQSMMSDTKLRGKVIWLLMTARIDRLSPDLRRPGRAGDIIIPVLDPEGDDHDAFVRWVLGSVIKNPSNELVDQVADLTRGYSAAAFDAVRRELAAESDREQLDDEEIFNLIRNRLLPDIAKTRQIQYLQALLNCTHKQLLPSDIGDDVEAQREQWRAELETLGY